MSGFLLSALNQFSNVSANSDLFLHPSGELVTNLMFSLFSSFSLGTSGALSRFSTVEEMMVPY